MNYFDAFILGLIQGLTEFLPVSSSGHLVLAEAILKVKQPGISFELIVHLGTLIAVVIYFRVILLRMIQSLFVKDMAKERKLILFLIIGTIPAGLAGVLLKDFFETTFNNPIETSIEIIITGVIILVPYFIRRGQKQVNFSSSLAMGVGQAIAILPGISRSGTTIATGMLTGVKPEEAAEFSFLLSIPAIAGALVLDLPEFAHVPSAMIGQYLLAASVSLLFGLISVYWVLSSIKRGRFKYFAYYCFAVGLFGLYYFL